MLLMTSRKTSSRPTVLVHNGVIEHPYAPTITFPIASCTQSRPSFAFNAGYYFAFAMLKEKELYFRCSSHNQRALSIAFDKRLWSNPSDQPSP